VVLDITMPGRSGLDFIKDVRAVYSDLKILVVSMHDELIYAERVLRAGAQGYVMKEAGGDNLLAAIRKVLDGHSYLSEKMTAKIVGELGAAPSRAASSPIRSLTDREFEIFRLIGEGRGTRAIAEQLHLSMKTVDVHKMHIKRKLKISDAAGLASFAMRWSQGAGEAR